MSVGSHSLNRPVLIVVVMVMGIAVTILNIRTFGARRNGPQATQARAQAFMGLPGDLDDVVRVAGRDLRDGLPGQEPGPEAYRDPSRDPFLGTDSGAETAYLKPEAVSRNRKSKRVPAPICSAVLPGGGQPLAVIRGKARRVGDSVDGWTVEAISTGGVILRDPRGRRRTLAVVPRDAAKKFSVSIGQQHAPVKDDAERMEP